MNGKKVKILYLQPFEYFGDTRFLTESFLRISNYLNSKKEELNIDIEEEYLDLRFEGLPLYCPENLNEYRLELKNLLLNTFERFNFEICAISCYTSFTYLNSMEVAFMIKNVINPSCYTIIGGYHPTVMSEDFYLKNIPDYLRDFYNPKASPIDFLVQDEGELPFFHFIKNFINGTISARSCLKDKPQILPRRIMEDLNELAVLNLDLFKKYKDIIKKNGDFYINFTRGCLFRCKFCSSSIDSKMKSYRSVRFKSIDRCIAEIDVILRTKWLSIDKLMIDDPVFFPKRSMKREFFQKFSKFKRIPFKIYVHDRIELCSREDLRNYKKFNLIPGFGLETGSPTLLCRLGKFLGKNNSIIHAKKYLQKVEEIIKYSNEIGAQIIFLCMGASPGMDSETIKESTEFFLSKRFSGKSLIEKYPINLQIQKFAILPGNTFYENGENFLFSKFYFKKWWKIFDKEQALYSTLLKPSKYLSFSEAMGFLKDFLSKLYRAQMRLKNPSYNLPEYFFHQKLYKRTLELYNYKVLKEKSIIY
ncbi:MAG: hypothetical protein GF353_28270 [Candidatus Lokiarchaeota archaeon]|nr:hypothetical protein [Candidatus Lokiarchaeota archaeon]